MRDEARTSNSNVEGLKLSEQVVKTFRAARVFHENADRVNAIDFSTNGETLITSSDDESIVIYDCQQGSSKKTLNSKKYGVDLIRFTGLMHLTGRPVANFDPEGLIFAAGINSEMIKLYDLRSFDKGPFSTFQLVKEKDCEWTNLKFSADGKMIMLSTNGTLIRLLDAFTGQIKHTLTGFANKNYSIEASFSPDAQFVFSGSSDGKLHCWNAETGNRVAVFNAEHGCVQCIQFNPKFMLLASACNHLIFWLPHLDYDMQ
ncbi:unnamed protein product [Didymodactylos carnosus]|uniref:WD repeat-containing protein 82 n=1 Tax=Didymodactylos carnosus TaxID=1234261 RepID=A0A814G8R8_9BILA|nr:unnamed protein product [Didymodactylos carnosus]CAF1399046.1 unnamed protein product [Didymodactylos carnosus]CAF3762556.1 unnamed protein product [Didymodactylos carnosus]CAF4206460.1 unnamed protein product [Didymodactylos carnosus]